MRAMVWMGWVSRWLLCASVMLGITSLAWAQTRDQTVVVKAVTAFAQAGAEVVVVELSQPLSAAPESFAVQSPARVVLDFHGISSGLEKNSVIFSQYNVKSVNLVQGEAKSRLVVNLKQLTPYKLQVNGNQVQIIFEPAQAVAGVSSARNDLFAESRNEGVLPLRDLDFRRGTDTAGRVVVTLPNNQTGVNIKNQGRDLIVELNKTSLPEGLRRTLDVADYGTPVQKIAAQQAGDSVRLLIESRGDWEHSAYQTDDQFVVEVRAKKIDTSKLTQGPSYSGAKLSLNFQNIEVRALLQVIADFTDFNVVTSDTVTGALTLRLKDVPWDQALQIILDAKGLGMRKSGNVLWVAPRDELDERTKKDLEAAKAIEELEPLRTQSFQLNYAKAGDVISHLTGDTGTGGAASSSSLSFSLGGLSASPAVRSRLLSVRGSATADARTNLLFVTDTVKKLLEVQELLLKLDVPLRQVLIEARIVEATASFGRSLGVKLGGSDKRGERGGTAGYSVGGGNRVAFAGNYNAVSNTTRETLGAVGNPTFVNLPIENPAATFALSIFSPTANRYLDLEISAMESDGKGRVVSSPRVTTADKTKAIIEQGTEIPYLSSTSSGATAVSFKKANLKLEVTPQITPEGAIILDLDVNKDQPNTALLQTVAIDTRHVQTQALVENGGTVVIGGIFTLDETEDVTQVPFLGDIPVVGNLFKSRVRKSEKIELIFFITPKIVSEKTVSR